MTQRLQKLIAEAGLCSRRTAEQWIREGRIKVNGIPAVLGQQADPAADQILVNGLPLSPTPEKIYIMLNKPRGFLTTLADDRGRSTVAELVGEIPERIFPVGRLDYDSDGLLLMTNDGALTRALTHPSHEVDKVYLTRVRGDIARAIPQLTGPMEIDGCTVRPAQVEVAGPNLLTITIHEGRNRQVRKMCAKAGLEVRRLTRIAEGPLRLGELPPGRWRFLTDHEIRSLRNLISGPL